MIGVWKKIRIGIFACAILVMLHSMLMLEVEEDVVGYEQ